MSMVERFLNAAEINEILTEFMSYERYQETDNDYVNDSGPISEAVYDLPSTLKHIDKFEVVLKSIYGPNLKFSNTFTRMYKNGNLLRIHTDRVGLDITVSLCLKRDVPWAIHVSRRRASDQWQDGADYDKTAYIKEYVSYDLFPGDFCHCYGRKDPHWRDQLTCNEDQSNIYVFYHWSLTE